MISIHDIEHAVSQLAPKELARFRAWFEEFEVAAWDKQFESDVKSGKLDQFAEQALTDFKAGKFKELWNISPPLLFGNVMRSFLKQYKNWLTRSSIFSRRILLIHR